MFQAFPRLTLCLFVAVTASTASRLATAAPGATATAGASLLAERARLRVELDRVNAEIDALKRAGRGVGEDYRLRARMADAEALARRLVAIEARLGLTAPAAAPRPLPVAAPTDSPADLEAKADILVDQSRRIREAADGLDRRLAELKGRQELRRRAADLDRDPFGPLEGSKRRTMSIAAGGGSQDTTHNLSQPSVDKIVITAPGTSNVGSTSGSAMTPTGISGSGSLALTQTQTGNPSPLAAAPLSLSVELRDLLDPATVADIGQIERAHTGGGSVTALQRAVAALRARAAAVDAQAQSMRRAAHQH
jgi:hypothetical protein